MSLTFFPFSNSFYSIYIVKENPSGIATLVKSDLQIGSSRREWSYDWLSYVNIKCTTAIQGEHRFGYEYIDVYPRL